MIKSALCYDTEAEANQAALRFSRVSVVKSVYTTRPWFVIVFDDE
jgi:hypothetical protein